MKGKKCFDRFESPWRDPFFVPSRPMFGSGPNFGNRCYKVQSEKLERRQKMLPQKCIAIFQSQFFFLEITTLLSQQAA